MDEWAFERFPEHLEGSRSSRNRPRACPPGNRDSGDCHRPTRRRNRGSILRLRLLERNLPSLESLRKKLAGKTVPAVAAILLLLAFHPLRDGLVLVSANGNGTEAPPRTTEARR